MHVLHPLFIDYAANHQAPFDALLHFLSESLAKVFFLKALKTTHSQRALRALNRRRSLAGTSKENYADIYEALCQQKVLRSLRRNRE